MAQLNLYDPTRSNPAFDLVQADDGPALRIRHESGGNALEVVGAGSSLLWSVDATGRASGALGWVNVKDPAYNATGNGATDDTAAIQSAITAAGNAGGGVVYLPSGTYRVAGTLTLPAGVWLMGASVDKTIIALDDANTNGISATGTSGVAQNLTANLVEGDTTLAVPDGTVFAAGDLIYVESAVLTDSSFTGRVKSVAANVVTLEDPAPISLTTANTARAFNAKNWISNVAVTDLTVQCAWGGTPTRQRLVYLNNVQNAVVRNVRGVFTGGEGTASASAFQCLNGYNVVFHRLRAEGILANTTAMALRFFNVTRGLIDGCRVRNSSSAYSLEACYQSAVVASVGSGSSTSGGRGCKSISSVDCVILGNHLIGFTASGYTGIHVDDSVNIRVIGNLVRDTSGPGISLGGSTVAGCHHCAVTGNTVVRACQGAAANAGAINVGVGTGSGSAMHVISDNVIRNVLGGAFGHGILIGSSDNSVTGNTVDGCQIGVLTQLTQSKNAITGNTIRNNAGRPINTTTGSGGHRLANNSWTASLPAYNSVDQVDQGDSYGTLTYSASMTPDPTVQKTSTITVTNATAMTINAPANCAAGMVMRLVFFNNTAGAIGAITLGAGISGAGAVTSPAAGKRRMLEFVYDGTNWVETYRSTTDI